MILPPSTSTTAALPSRLPNTASLVNPEHRTHARQRWLDIVPFDYPLEWNTTTRAFKASEPVSVDLMVVSAEHNLTYMSPDWAEIDFGASLNLALDIPEINTANLASTVLELTGISQALAEESTEALGGILTDGIDQMAQLANDQLDELFDRALSSLDGPIDTLAAQIVAANGDINAIETLINDELCSATGRVSEVIHDLAEQTGGASDLLDEVDESLAKAQWAIRSVIGYIPEDGIIDLDAIVDLPEIEFSDDLGANAAQGLFAEGEGAGYELVRALVACLIDELGGEAAAGLNAVAGSVLEAVEEELNALLAEAEPTIDDIRTVLMDVHNTIGDIRTELAAGQGIAADMEQIFTDGAAEIDAVLAESKDAIMEFLESADIPELDSEEIKSRIRQEVRDRFNASALIAEVQVLLKQYVADLEDAMNEAIESVFAEVNKMIVALLVDALPDLQEELNGMLGDVNSLAATGNIDGFARINGDALRSLRLDAAMQLSLPDPFEFGGYIEINQLDSNGDGTCSVELMDPDAYAAEVKMGANNIPVRFVGSDLRFDVGAKFSFDTDGGFNLRGFGGSLDMTEGEISVEAVTIFELGAAVAFGLDENYLAARVGLTFDQYTMAGGVFFGRTCTIDPLLIADPDVGEVLGEPPFTGIYTYGEAQIPIVGASCLFSLQANAGAGVFVFAEGPTIGGKMKMGVTGKAICAVTVGGEVTLIGAKVGNEFNFFGRGRVFGEVGEDPFSIGFDESVEMTYRSNEWEYDF